MNLGGRPRVGAQPAANLTAGHFRNLPVCQTVNSKVQRPQPRAFRPRTCTCARPLSGELPLQLPVARQQRGRRARRKPLHRSAAKRCEHVRNSVGDFVRQQTAVGDGRARSCGGVQVNGSEGGLRRW
jgi:hypothetical protein